VEIAEIRTGNKEDQLAAYGEVVLHHFRRAVIRHKKAGGVELDRLIHSGTRTTKHIDISRERSPPEYGKDLLLQPITHTRIIPSTTNQQPTSPNHAPSFPRNILFLLPLPPKNNPIILVLSIESHHLLLDDPYHHHHLPPS